MSKTPTTSVHESVSRDTACHSNTPSPEELSQLGFIIGIIDDSILDDVDDIPNTFPGAGFTGGRFRINWKDAEFRKLVLNALPRITKVEVPAEGVATTMIVEDYCKTLDPKGKT